MWKQGSNTKHRKNDLKVQWHEIVDLWIFSLIDPVWTPECHTNIFSNSVSNSRRYSDLHVYQRCRIQHWFKFYLKIGKDFKFFFSIEVSFNTNYWKKIILLYFQVQPSLLKFKNRISAVFMNQRCIIQRWFRISAVSDNTDISFQRYVFA